MAQHNVLGHSGEDAAVEYLERKGYTICERNWRKQHLELDIVASRNGKLIVIEVKTRTDTENGEPIDAVNGQKRNRIIKATDAYIKQYNLDVPVRFDVITIVGEAGTFRIEHIEDAFHAY